MVTKKRKREPAKERRAKTKVIQLSLCKKKDLFAHAFEVFNYSFFFFFDFFSSVLYHSEREERNKQKKRENLVLKDRDCCQCRTQKLKHIALIISKENV